MYNEISLYAWQHTVSPSPHTSPFGSVRGTCENFWTLDSSVRLESPLGPLGDVYSR